MTQNDEPVPEDDEAVTDTDVECDKRHAPDRVSVAWFAVMALVAVALVGAGLHAVIQLTSVHGDHPVVQVVVQGQAIQLSEDEVPEFNDNLKQQIASEHEQLISELEAGIDSRVDALFEEPVERIPRYVDWYYSLWASPVRLYAIATGGIEQHLTENFDERVLGGDAFSEDLRSVEAQLDSRVQTALSDMGSQVETALLDTYEAREVADDAKGEHSEAPLVDLSHGFDSALSAVRREELFKWGVNVGVASASTATVMGRPGGRPSVASRVVQASRGLRHVVSKRWGHLATRVSRPAARAARAASAGVTSMAVTAPTGLGAPVIGATVAVGTFVGSEALALKIQEWASADAMEEDLENALVVAREEVKQELILAYRSQINARQRAVVAELENRAASVGEEDQFFVLGGAAR